MDTDVLVLGAGPAGLAVAAALAGRGKRAHIIEQAQHAGASWREHYERLRLHTVKSHSALPGLLFADHLPRYVPRREVAEYLVRYAEHFDLRLQFGEQAVSVTRRGDGWLTTTASGLRFESNAVVVATGANRVPFTPRFDGQEAFTGHILHSRDYRNAAPFVGQRVLVVGMGNTGAEIALDLVEHGVSAALSVRSPINVVYRDVLGRPTQLSAIALARLPHALGDAIALWLRRLTVGDMGRYGLRLRDSSPLYDLRELGKTPVIDIGTLARIRSGEIGMRPGIEQLTTNGARFVDGSEGMFDALIAATGYRSNVQALFPNREIDLDANGLPTQLAGTGDLAGVYFVGFDTRQAGGLLRTIGMQANVVADALCAASPTTA